jgi:hypothetical protein
VAQPVAAVGPVRGDLAIGGVAEGVDLGRHQALGEHLDRLTEQVAAAVLEVLAKPLERVHVVADVDRISSQFVLYGTF